MILEKSTSCIIQDRAKITNLLISISTMVTVVNKVKWNLLNSSIIHIALKIAAYIVTESQTQN